VEAPTNYRGLLAITKSNQRGQSTQTCLVPTLLPSIFVRPNRYKLAA
jgi:hypothetical protein